MIKRSLPTSYLLPVQYLTCLSFSVNLKTMKVCMIMNRDVDLNLPVCSNLFPKWWLTEWYRNFLQGYIKWSSGCWNRQRCNLEDAESRCMLLVLCNLLCFKCLHTQNLQFRSENHSALTFGVVTYLCNKIHNGVAFLPIYAANIYQCVKCECMHA